MGQVVGVVELVKVMVDEVGEQGCWVGLGSVVELPVVQVVVVLEHWHWFHAG